MAETLHLPEEQEPQVEQIQLGDQTVELDPATARIVRQQYESLAAQYGAALEDYRRQAFQTIGTQQAPPQFQPPPVPDGLSVPDPDLLFQNKGAWTQEFANSLEGRLAALDQQNVQRAQGLAQAFQAELARRDAAQAAQSRHDAAMTEMLERRGLGDNQLVVQAVYDREYEKIKHLPLEMGLDKIGAMAQEEIEKIRSGEQWQLTPSTAQTGVAPRPPAMLRSARRAAPRPAPAPAQEQLQSPGGGLGAMGSIIRKRQQQLMRSESA